MCVLIDLLFLSFICFLNSSFNEQGSGFINTLETWMLLNNAGVLTALFVLWWWRSWCLHHFL